MKASLKQSATDRADAGRRIATALRDALIATPLKNAPELTVLAHRIQLCNQLGNVWFAKDMHTADGECFDGSGRFWNCGSKLCPSCVARQAKRNRANLQQAIELQKPLSGQRFQMLTLTMPNEGLPLLTARSIMIHAWQLLRKRKWFKETIIGAARSEEFTLTRKGFHYHMHLLALTKYVSFATFRAEWTDCLAKAFDAHDHPITFATVDGLARTHVTPVRSMKGAIQEVAKYITKADSWSKLRSEDLTAIASIRRFPRMFELIGSFKIASSVSVADDEDLGEDEAYVHTTSLSDGKSAYGWREQLDAIGVAEYLQVLRDEVIEKSAFRIDQLKRRYPVAQFSRLKAPPMPSEGSVLRFLAQAMRDCPSCHKPMLEHDLSVKYANHCGLVIL